MVEMIRLADEPWAPVAQGHPGAEVVRSVRVAPRGMNGNVDRAPANKASISRRTDGGFGPTFCYLATIVFTGQT
jgi:hypothetical protein